jgi:hypothetical protein
MATSISVFVDPACPWAWITSRWITGVACQRDLTIRWRSFSPEVRDGGVCLPPAIPEHLRQVALERRRIGAMASRVFEWLRSEIGEQAVGRFYTELGYRLNDPERPGCPPMPGIIGASLKAADLGEAAEAAAPDPIWQRRVARSTEEALAMVGRHAMTPVIAAETDPPAALSAPSCRRPRSAPSCSAVGCLCRPAREPHVPRGTQGPLDAAVPPAAGIALTEQEDRLMREPRETATSEVTST